MPPPSISGHSFDILPPLSITSAAISSIERQSTGHSLRDTNTLIEILTQNNNDQQRWLKCSRKLGLNVAENQAHDKEGMRVEEYDDHDMKEEREW